MGVNRLGQRHDELIIVVAIVAVVTLAISGSARAGQTSPTLGDKAREANQAIPRSPHPSVEHRSIVAGRGLRTVIIPLNHIGIFDSRFLNPRNPPDLLAFDDTADTTQTDLETAINTSKCAASDPYGDEQCRNKFLGLTSQLVTADWTKLKNNGGLAALPDRDEADPLRVPLQQARDRLRAVYAELVRIRLDNRTADQSLVVSFSVSVPADIEAGALSLAAVQTLVQGRHPTIHIGNCQKGDSGQMCAATVTIRPRSYAFVPLDLFLHLDRSGTPPVLVAGPTTPITFQVAFFNENATPAHAKGFFSVVPADELTELPSATNWSLAASISATREPDLGDSTAMFSTTSTYSGDRISHLPGAGTLSAAPNLGSRAEASIDLDYKKADLGDVTDKGTVAASRYEVDVHAVSGLTLSFGKFAFATPTSSVAIDEEGDGFRLAYKDLAVSQIINRESATGTADAANKDDKEVIVEANNLSGVNWRGIESLNVIALYGRDSFTTPPVVPGTTTTALPVNDGTVAMPASAMGVAQPMQAHDYWTVGGEAFLLFPTDHLRASAAFYHSATHSIAGSSSAAQSGNVAYMTATWTFFGAVGDDGTEKVQSTIVTQYAQGSAAKGDSFATAYVGEHQKFAPDVLFFSALAPKTVATPGLGAGLGNKQYVSVAYSDLRKSPLHLVAWALQIPPADIASEATTFQWHHYNLRSVSGPTTLGDEFDVTFQIETPAGITSQVQASYFRPGEAINSIVTASPWALTASVKIKM